MPLLEIYRRGMKTYVQAKYYPQCLEQFYSQPLKPGNNPNAQQLLNGLTHSYNRIPVSKKELLIHAITWMTLKSIMLTESS